MRYRPSTHNQEIKKAEYGIEVFYTTTPQCSAIGYRGKSAKKSFFYRFNSEERMMEYINNFIDSVVKREDAKQEKKSVIKALQQNMKASDHFKVGDIVFNSWGWEQTNIEFYQVIEVLNKKIKVQEVKQLMTHDEGMSSMSGYVMPKKDDFIKDPFLLLLKVDEKGNCRICNPKSFFYFKKWGGGKKYCSWYA